MEYFGLDIGSYRLKAVQLARQGDKYGLVALGSAPSVGKGLLSEAESDLTALAEAIKKLHLDTKIATKNVVTALPQDEVFTRVITFPKISEEELSSALRWEAEQYIPIPLAEVTLAHQVVGALRKEKKEMMEVLLVAAPTRLVHKLAKVLDTAGLNPVSIETEILALARSLATSESDTTLLIDLGARATDLAIIEKGDVIFTRSIPTAGEALTRAVVSSLGLSLEQAEAYKKAYGVDSSKLEGKVSRAIEPILGVIVGEMEKAIHFCRSERGKIIGRALLVGGTAGLPEAVSLLAQKLNIEVQLGRPFLNVAEDGLLSKLPENELPHYAVAVGLAMKAVD